MGANWISIQNPGARPESEFTQSGGTSMKNKTLISSIIVISIIVGLVFMLTSGSSDTVTVPNTAQQTTTIDADKSLVQAPSKLEQKKSMETALVVKTSQNKVAKKPKPQKQSQRKITVTKSESGSNSRVIRVSRPGQKFRMVRVEKINIPPNSELRKWTRNQWVTKVSTLRGEGKDSLAQEYITAYKTQYPNKDLHKYLK